MAVTVSPAALPARKKNAFYAVILTAAGGTGPYSWAVTAGALPTGTTLTRINDTQAVVQGKTPAALDAATFTCTITATDSLSATGTCVSTTVTHIVDGPDAQAYHGTEANRTTVQLIDQIEHGTGITSAADAIQRMWPLTGPAQNS